MFCASYDDCICNASAFYKSDAIKIAKELLFKICKEKITNRKNGKDNPAITSDIKDILNLLEKMESKRFLLPKFVADNFTSLPPSSGFLAMAKIMNAFRDEVSALREEVSQLRQAKEIGIKTIEDASDIKQDISDIKILLTSTTNATNSNLRANTTTAINNTNTNNSTTATNMADQSNRPNLDRTYAEAFASTPAPFNSEGRRRQNRSVPQPPSSPTGNAASHSPQRIPQRSGGQRRVDHLNINGKGFGGNRRQGQINNRDRRENVVGTAPQANNGFGGTVKTLDIYVGGCLPTTTPQLIKEHCEEIFNLNFIECEPIDTRNKYCKAFKVSVHATHRNELLKPEFWPQGVIVNKYFKPRYHFNRGPNEGSSNSNINNNNAANAVNEDRVNNATDASIAVNSEDQLNNSSNN